jgi:hypothetical protein
LKKNKTDNFSIKRMREKMYREKRERYTEINTQNFMEEEK